MPTSLTRLRLPTRGCSPWRPDAVLGTTGREGQDPPPGFQGPAGVGRAAHEGAALPAEPPPLRTTRFRGLTGLLSRKENSPQLPRRRPRVRLRCRGHPASWCGNVNPLPFRWTACWTPSHGVTPSLRVDSPMSNRSLHGTLLHSSPQGSRLNLCYFHQDLHSSPFHLNSHLRLLHKLDALLLTGTEALSRRRCIGHTLKRHPFSGPMRSAGELLHTP